MSEMSKTLDECRDSVRALENALKKLRAEVAGAISYAGMEIRDAIGNTNMAVLKQRVAEADDVLGRSMDTLPTDLRFFEFPVRTRAAITSRS